MYIPVKDICDNFQKVVPNNCEASSGWPHQIQSADTHLRLPPQQNKHFHLSETFFSHISSFCYTDAPLIIC